MTPIPCTHPEDYIVCTKTAQWVYGDGIAWTPAEYYCRRCKVTWKQPDEPPHQPTGWTGTGERI